jgi:EamA-like transporter family.
MNLILSSLFRTSVRWCFSPFLHPIIAFWSYLTLLGRVGVERAAYATLIFPLVALGISTIFEGYQWTAYAVIGIVLILGGNLLILKRSI